MGAVPRRRGRVLGRAKRCNYTFFAPSPLAGEGQGRVGVLDDGGESVELVRMYTDRTVRRRGLGRRLLDHLLAHARSACPAARSVWLSTPTANTPGLEFYEAVGFAVEEDFTPPGGWAPELRRFRRRLEPSYCCS